jgi:hypothetical protein
MLPPHSYLDVLIVICVGLTLVSNLASWFFVFNVFKVRDLRVSLLLGEELVNWLVARDLPTAQTGFGYRLADDAFKNRETVENKMDWLVRGYYGMLSNTFFLILMLVFTACRYWIATDQPMVVGWNASWFFLE